MKKDKNKNKNKKMRKIYSIAEKLEANILSALLMTILISVILVINVTKGTFNIKDFIDTQVLSSIFAVLLCGIFADIIRKNIEKKCEDYAKLTKDYDELNKKYSSNNLIKVNMGKEKNVFPVICLLMKNKDYDKICINDNKEKKYQIPTQICEHSEEIMKVHKQSKLYNNINVRLDKIYVEDKTVILNTSRTTYFDSMITNRAMDLQWNNKKSIREVYEPGPYISELEDSRLSNHLGFNGFVETTEGKIIFVLRKDNVSIGKNTLADSIGASLKTKYAIDQNHDVDLTGIGTAILAEIKDELGIDVIGEVIKRKGIECNQRKKEELERKLVNITVNSIIAFYRDLVEGGKPQFLFYLKLSDIDDCFNNEFVRNVFNSNKKSIKGKTDKETNMKIDGEKYILLSIKELQKTYIDAGKIVLNSNSKHDNEYEMMPSASACIVMLLKYIENNKN